MSRPEVAPIVALTYASAIDDPGSFRSPNGRARIRPEAGETHYRDRSKVGSRSAHGTV